MSTLIYSDDERILLQEGVRLLRTEPFVFGFVPVKVPGKADQPPGLLVLRRRSRVREPEKVRILFRKIAQDLAKAGRDVRFTYSRAIVGTAEFRDGHVHFETGEDAKKLSNFSIALKAIARLEEVPLLARFTFEGLPEGGQEELEGGLELVPVDPARVEAIERREDAQMRRELEEVDAILGGGLDELRGKLPDPLRQGLQRLELALAWSEHQLGLLADRIQKFAARELAAAKLLEGEARKQKVKLARDLLRIAQRQLHEALGYARLGELSAALTDLALTPQDAHGPLLQDIAHAADACREHLERDPRLEAAQSNPFLIEVELTREIELALNFIGTAARRLGA